MSATKPQPRYGLRADYGYHEPKIRQPILTIDPPCLKFIEVHPDLIEQISDGHWSVPLQVSLRELYPGSSQVELLMRLV